MTLIGLFDVLLAAGAGFYIWMFLSQLETPGFVRFQRWFRRGWRVPLIGCPYCFGFWISVALILAMHLPRLHWLGTPVSILATAAIIGFVGSFTPGMEEEDD